MVSEKSYAFSCVLIGRKFTIVLDDFLMVSLGYIGILAVPT